MVYIDDVWRKVEDMDDVIDIIREKIGFELAEKVEEIYSGLKFNISELRSELGEAIDRIEELEYELEEK